MTQDEPTPHVAAPPAGEPAAEPSADKAAKRTWLQILFFFACIVLAVVWPGLFFLTTGDATLNLNSAGIAASFAAALVIPVWLLGQIPALGGRRAARGFTALAILIVFALALGAGMIWPQMRSVQQSAMASAFGPLVAQISSDTKSMAAKGPSTQKAQKPPVAQTQQKWQPDMIVSLDPRGSALIKAKNPAARAKKIIIDGKEPRNDYDFAVLLAQKRIRLSGSKKANALDYWNLSGVDRKLLEHKHSGAWCTASMKAKLPLTQVTAGDINPFIDDHDRNRTQFATCSFVGLVSGQNGQQAVLLFDVQAKYKRDFEKMEVNAIQKYVNDLIKDRRISNAVKYRDVKFDGLGTHKFTGKSKFTGKPDAEFYPVVVSLSGTNFKSGRTERYLEVIGIVDGWEVQTWIYFPEFARSVVEKEVTTAWLNMAEGIKYRTAFNKR